MAKRSANPLSQSKLKESCSPLIVKTNLYSGNLCYKNVSIDSDGYIIWNGNDFRSVDKDTIVAVKVRGQIPRVPVRAGDWPQICWMHRHKDDDMNKWDIIAYKVIK